VSLPSAGDLNNRRADQKTPLMSLCLTAFSGTELNAWARDPDGRLEPRLYAAATRGSGRLPPVTSEASSLPGTVSSREPGGMRRPRPAGTVRLGAGGRLRGPPSLPGMGMTLRAPRCTGNAPIQCRGWIRRHRPAGTARLCAGAFGYPRRPRERGDRPSGGQRALRGLRHLWDGFRARPQPRGARPGAARGSRRSLPPFQARSTGRHKASRAHPAGSRVDPVPAAWRDGQTGRRSR
jgi:hypothetical protein